MGFFSFKCSKSDLSIPAYPYAGLPITASKVILITPKNELIEGIYDGYGKIDGIDIYAKLSLHILGTENRNLIFKNDSTFYTAQNLVKIVRADHYNGESFKELKTSESCPDQGYFYDDTTRREYL